MDRLKSCPICGEGVRLAEIHLCGSIPTLIHECINGMEIKIRSDSKQGVVKKWNAYANIAGGISASQRKEANGMRLIDADYVRDEILFGEAYVSDELAVYIKRLFEETRTIDPVHAAGGCYCRECRSYNKPRLGYCDFHLGRMNPADFCSYGRRREGAE